MGSPCGEALVHHHRPHGSGGTGQAEPGGDHDDNHGYGGDNHRPLSQGEEKELTPSGLEQKLLIACRQLLEGGDRPRPLDRHEQQLGGGLVDVLSSGNWGDRKGRWTHCWLPRGAEAEVQGSARGLEVKGCQGDLAEVGGGQQCLPGSGRGGGGSWGGGVVVRLLHLLLLLLGHRGGAHLGLSTDETLRVDLHLQPLSSLSFHCLCWPEC